MSEQIGFHNGAGSARRQLISAFWKRNDTNVSYLKRNFGRTLSTGSVIYHESWMQSSVQPLGLPMLFSMMLLCSSNFDQQLTSLDRKIHSTSRKMFQNVLLSLVNQQLNLGRGSCLQFLRHHIVLYWGTHLGLGCIFWEHSQSDSHMSQTLIS